MMSYRTPMKILKIFTLAVIVAAFAGCAHNIKNSPAMVFPSPPGFKNASLHREGIKSAILGQGILTKNDKEIDIEMFNLLTERAIYDNINKFSRGKINASEDADVIVNKIELTGDHPALSFGDNIGLGLLSFIIPPLAAIKGEMNYPVSVYFEFSDRDRKLMYSDKVDFTIEGTYWGWYVGRPLAARKLLVAEEKFMEEAAAIAVLNAIYENYPKMATWRKVTRERE